jgi:hypothetical protein
MPVILKSGGCSAWLEEEPADAPQLKAMLAPYPAEKRTCWAGQHARRQRQEQ